MRTLLGLIWVGIAAGAAGQVTPAKPSCLQGVWADPTAASEARVATADRSVPLYPGEAILGIKEIGATAFVPTKDWEAIRRFVEAAKGAAYVVQVRDKTGQVAEVLVRADPSARVGPAKPPETRTPPSSGTRLSAEEVFRTLRDRVVIVRTDVAQGTGFVVGSPNVVATCAHLIGDATEVTIVSADGKARVPRAVAVDEASDLAVLEFAEPVAPEPVPLGESGEAAIGATTFVIGHPLGLSFTISNGIVSAMRAERGLSEVQFTAPISIGNSGSPLLDDHGRAIGVVAKLRESGQNLNFAIATSHLKALLGRGRIALATFLASRPAREARASPLDPDAASSAIGRLLDRLFSLALEWDIARRRGDRESGEAFVERFDRLCDDEIESGDLVRPFVGAGTETWKSVLAWVLDVRTQARAQARSGRTTFDALYEEAARPLSRFKGEPWFRTERAESRLSGLREATALSPDFLPDPNGRTRCRVGWAAPDAELAVGDRIVAIVAPSGEPKPVGGWRDVVAPPGSNSITVVVERDGRPARCRVRIR